MKVLIAGLGLIGGSFALALRDHGIAEEILGVESSEEHAAEALQLGLADRIVSFEEGVPEADLVVLATPVDTIPLMAVKALNRAGGRQVVMDMGSIKGELCEVISMHARRGRFVAAHPMWGTEYSGPKAAQRGAFTGRSVVLCDTVRSDKDALATVEGIFRTLGSPAVYMDPEEHDLHAAYVSHISHVTSSRWRSRCSKRSARSVTSSTWRAAVSRARCAWPRVRRQRGSRSCCATNTTCWTCCANTYTSCKSCAGCSNATTPRG